MADPDQLTIQIFQDARGNRVLHNGRIIQQGLSRLKIDLNFAEGTHTFHVEYRRDTGELGVRRRISEAIEAMGRYYPIVSDEPGEPSWQRLLEEEG